MSAVVWTKGTVLRGLSDQEPLTEAPSLRTPADSFLPVCKLTEAVFPTKAWKAPPPLLSGRPLPPMSSTPGVHASSLSVPQGRGSGVFGSQLSLSATNAGLRPWAFERRSLENIPK